MATRTATRERFSTVYESAAGTASAKCSGGVRSIRRSLGPGPSTASAMVATSSAAAMASASGMKSGTPGESASNSATAASTQRNRAVIHSGSQSFIRNSARGLRLG